ncbi:MAG: Fur family transcriptional regulator [Hyphomicrobiaceae bacterium]
MAAARKLTPNQAIVLGALEAAETPMTAYQILNAQSVREAGVRAPLTVYRALEGLQQRGLVHRIEQLNAFVCCGHGHHHTPAVFLICSHCRKTAEVPARQVRQLLMALAEGQRFVPERISVEIAGSCAACAVKQG